MRALKHSNELALPLHILQGAQRRHTLKGADIEFVLALLRGADVAAQAGNVGRPRSLPQLPLQLAVRFRLQLELKGVVGAR